MSHYFSRVRLKTRPRDMALLASLSRHGQAYRDHALIWRLFPGDGAERDFVFRRMQDDRGQTSYFVVSQRAPRAEPGLLDVQTKPYAPRMREGETIRFELRANPTVSRGTSGQRSRRHDVLMDAKQQTIDPQARRTAMDAAAIDWLIRRAPGWGLAIAAECVLTSGYAQHRLRRKGQPIEFSSLDYQGIAQVTDTDRLTQALLRGVGHARGFGCGLLLAARLP
ncbi:type I-E CRISPR-associated protein Cas6/Cse3/CasE [Ralstonia pseudosolanacearum]|uniref:type I-E CRISPR-associated protein Cas6/Cse3/CasE n=1 Tax=Ralstonia pseudosolanacearum TaxID=1310165 RepID=UPI001C8B2AE2|nr:type I-E CRISPR-associated protein Cas6/Cse3/CasE [Ralstonia pseudosolanacearum]MBX9428375.1 type I-E CRISPR-associated protein Cas6/Cse3/CasE [Ralstonia pseudosolanacearum]